jgi:hypothetical protein
LKAFLTDIKNKIFADVPAVKTVRLWNNQVEEIITQRNESISFPAVFLGFDTDINYISKTAQGLQYAEKVEFYVHITDENYVDNVNDDSTEWGIIDLKQDIYKALEQFSGVTFGNISRIRESVDQSHDSIYHYTQVYMIPILVDADNCPETTDVMATLDLAIDLNIENVIIRTGRLGGALPPPTEDIQLDYELDFRLN